MSDDVFVISNNKLTAQVTKKQRRFRPVVGIWLVYQPQRFVCVYVFSDITFDFCTRFQQHAANGDAQTNTETSKNIEQRASKEHRPPWRHLA